MTPTTAPIQLPQYAFAALISTDFMAAILSYRKQRHDHALLHLTNY